MSNPNLNLRSLVVLCICVPLAILLGYYSAVPLGWTTLILFGVIIGILSMPFLLRWHSLLLVACWNMNAIVFLLPGRPPLWLFLVALSLVLSLLAYTLDKNKSYLSVPSVVRPLIFLAIVILVTAKFRGGIGLGSFGGGSSGGKRYIYLLGAILGYVAITWNPIPKNRAALYLTLFFLGGASAAIGNLFPLVNPAFYIIFHIFPPEQSGFEALGLVQQEAVTRFGGLTFASTAVFCALLSRYGIGGIFDFSAPLKFLPFQFKGGFAVNKPWRLLLFFLASFIGLFGGFRLMIATFAMIFFVLFCYENLFRSRLFPVFIFSGILLAIAVLPFANKLPLPMQRSISFLPVEVDPIARSSAVSSTEWRLAMWKLVLQQVPDYVLLGKGYGLNTHELEVVSDQVAMGQGDSMEVAWLAGDYHNGPLSLIVPLGIWGVIGFGWFVIAAIRVLKRNYQYGDESLRTMNRFLLSLFVAKVIYYFFFFGSFYNDLVFFTGIIGLSVSMNAGIRTKQVKHAEVAQPEPELA